MLHTSADNIPSSAQGCVIVIGNFDGVHLGHRFLIKQAGEIADNLRAPLGAVTFDPHPRRFFQPDADPFHLTLLPMKSALLSEAGIDHVFALTFDDALSMLTGEEFIDQILVKKLQARHIVIGEGFVFGHNRSGNIETLKHAAAAGKFHLTVVQPFTLPDGGVCSSTVIRNTLCQAKFDAAEKMLGRPWVIEAKVVEGDKRGRTLGFPTANQNVPEYVRIPYGIYAVLAQIEGENIWRPAAANFGVRPMFEIRRPIFETFIFDFNQEIYGKILRVRPVKYLRPEMAFQGIPALVAQMKEDCIEAGAVLKSIQVL